MGNPAQDLLDLVQRKVTDKLHTSIPAVVTKVSDYAEKQVIDCQPVLNSTDDSGVFLKPPVLAEVPVLLYSGGGALFSVPIAVGDIVELHFQMGDISRWKIGDGQVISPDTRRMHNLNDAIAVPCLSTLQTTLKPDATDLVVKFSGSEIRIKPDGNVSVKSAKDVTVEAINVNVKAATTATIEATTADIKAMNINLGTGGLPIARQGDTVQVVVASGSSAGTWPGTIISGSTKNTSA